MTAHSFNKLPSFDPDNLDGKKVEAFEEDDYDEDYEDYEDEDGEDFDESDEEIEDTKPIETKILDFDDILDVDDTGEETIFIKEWGGSVIIKGVTKSEFDHLRRMSRSKQNKGRSNAIIERELLIAGLVKPRIDVARYNLLQDKSSGVILKLTQKVLEKSGLADDAENRREKRFPRQR
jgi:hypothetical protein